MYGLEAKELWIENPLLYTDVEKYIWISNSYEKHKEAQNLFSYLLQKEIYIHGFVTDSPFMVGLKMFHKRIYGTDVLNKDNAVVFCDLDTDVSDISVIDKVQYIKTVHPDMDGDNVVIWGSGVTGEQVFSILKRNSVKIKYFVDSDETKVGLVKCGLPVYSPKKLDSENENIEIVEAMEKWKELDDTIQNKYEKRFYYQWHSKQKYSMSITSDIDGMKKTVFSLSDDTFYYIGDEKIYIYGIGGIEREAAKYLKLMDFDFNGFLVDNLDEENGDENIPVKYVEEILYETDFKIWVYEGMKVAKLDELGLKYFRNYIFSMHATDITIRRRNVLDINLGHNYLSQGKFPGFVCYGSAGEEDYRIVTLGGSTTDGMIYPFKSWPQLLYEKMENENITIYNGGIYAYKSGQEVLKLIRDVLALKPNMIIVYDGFNDTYMDERYPYAFDYLNQIFKYADAHIEKDAYMEDGKGIICKGIASQNERFDNWLSNIRTMYAIASERNIYFFSFFQPALWSKKGKTVQEKNMLLSTKSEQINFQVNSSFRDCMIRATQIPSYVYDLSHIFDNKTDIYMDPCHVWEEGNRIIAQEIEKVILPVLKENGVL